LRWFGRGGFFTPLQKAVKQLLGLLVSCRLARRRFQLCERGLRFYLSLVRRQSDARSELEILKNHNNLASFCQYLKS